MKQLEGQIMSELQYFQRYHGKENVHSSNALFLLKRLYLYSPKKFYEVLGAIIKKQGELEDLSPAFIVQDTNNGKKSIPDFSIVQPSFKIAVEAKEGTFDIEQLERHLDGLSKLNDYKHKILIALSPKNDIQHQLDNLRKSFEGITIVHMSYMNFYDIITGVLDKVKDLSFTEYLEDYKEYCEQEGLVDYSNDTIMVRATNDTYEFNTSVGVYYDIAKCSPLGFQYLGLYKNQSVLNVGKIKKIVEAHIGEDGNPIYGKPVFGGALTVSDKEKIDAAIIDRKQRYHNEIEPHWHFIVEEFVPVINFKKKKGGLLGKKKFYLKEDFNMENIDGCNITDIAQAMENYDKWD